MQVKVNFGTEKQVLIQKYRFALEQALAKADFVTAPDITVVQAFLLFLVLVRRHDDTRFAWTLTSLLIRISQALGLHRDGTNFPNLTPFEIEMRRRLFWAVCVLDLRSAEDQGTDLTIVHGTFDTQLPLNINDTDISPESESLPEPREGTTDMAFSLIRYEICALSRRLHTVSSDMALTCSPDAGKSLEEREALLTDLYRRIKQRLLKDSSTPMFFVASNITRVIVAKMTLVIYQSVLFPGSGNECLSEEVRARLFNAALDVFEYNHILNTDPRCKQWRWLFQTWSHWHALAYILLEVSHRPWGPKAERAWAALNLSFSYPNPAELEKLSSHHAVWVPLRKLYLKVKKHREAEIARLKADPQAARELDVQDQAGASPTSLGTVPGSVKDAVLERWRKLVNLPPSQQESALGPQPQHHQHLHSNPHQQQQQQQQQLQQQQSRPIDAGSGRHVQPNHTMSSGMQGGASGDFGKPELVEYLDAAMTSSAFVPPDFAQLWATNGSTDMARPAFFAYPGGDISRVDSNSSSMGFVPGTPMPGELQMGRGQPATGGAMGGHGVPQQQAQSASAVVQTPATNDENNLPPWLWAEATGSPDILRMPNMAAEDMDINMDEGFDWQTWQESLGRYELEANGVRAGSTWPAL